jgi:hypothetical protein
MVYSAGGDMSDEIVETPPVETRTCPFCKEQMRKEAIACPHCTRQSLTPKDGKILSIIICCMLGVAALVFVIIATSSSETGPSVAESADYARDLLRRYQTESQDVSARAAELVQRNRIEDARKLLSGRAGTVMADIITAKYDSSMTAQDREVVLRALRAEAASIDEMLSKTPDAPEKGRKPAKVVR